MTASLSIKNFEVPHKSSSIASFWCLYRKLSTDFTYFSVFSIADFEQVNTDRLLTFINTFLTFIIPLKPEKILKRHVKKDIFQYQKY